MSRNVKYRTEFTDINILDWKIDIDEDSFGGSITTMQAAGNPLSFEYFAQTDDLFDSPIKGSACDLVVLSESDFKWLDIYKYDDRHFRMSVYNNADVLFWQGYITTGEYTEPYDRADYEVLITATDLLGSLKNEPYKSDATTYYDGRKKESQIILDILGKIGATTFTEYVNIYESSMSNETTDSPFTQTVIDVDVFRDKSCYEVLEEILKSYNAVIRQVNGVYTIYRPKELSGASVYGRIITSSTITGTTLSPRQFINRPDVISDIRDLEGGELSVISPVKSVLPTQDYGYKESWISNYEIKGNTFTGGDITWTLDGWTKTNAWLIQPMHLIGERDGVWLLSANTYPTFNYYLSQSFGSFALTTTDYCTFEFDYLILNKTAIATMQAYYIEIKSDVGSKYLYNTADHKGDWGDTQNYVAYEVTSEPGISGWQHYQMQVLGIPLSGSYTIKLMGPPDPNTAIIGYKNIKFKSTADEVAVRFRKAPKDPNELFYFGKRPLLPYQDYVDVPEIVSREYTVSCSPAYGRTLEPMYLIGDVTDANIDNILEQFAGALSRRLSLTTLAAYFVTDHAAAYLAGDVIVTSSGPAISFESSVAGQDFLGVTSITALSGDLNTEAATTIQPNVPVSAQWESDFNYIENEKCSNDGVNYIATTSSIGQEPPNETYWSVDPDQPQVRIDRITLTGEYGSASILCDNVTRTTRSTEISTSAWNTRGGSEADPLLQIIGDELAAQTSRPKQMLRLPVLDEATNPSINLIGNFQDILNSSYGTGGNLVTNPSSGYCDYDSFVIDDMDITASNASGAAEALSNGFSVTNGDVIILLATLSDYWNEVPSVLLRNSATGGSISGAAQPLASGINTITLTVNTTCTATLKISNTAACSWTVESMCLFRNPRKFVFNKGMFNVKDREWELNINEII